MSHVVTAPLVIAKGEDGKDVYLYGGTAVPSGLPKAEVARLVEGGFFESADKAEDDVKSDAAKSDAPAGNASREEWAAYALGNGATDEEVADDGLSRNDLRDKYGK